MRLALLLLACVALFGCGAFSGGGADKTSGDAGAEAVDPEHFHGNHIGVWVDGNKAIKEPGPAGAGVTYWSVPPPVGNSMEVKVSAVESHLGKVVHLSVVLNPAMEDGSPDVRDVWQPLGSGNLEPDTACRIGGADGFRHIRSDTVNPRETLIPGKYVMTVRVNGEISWDRKFIRLDVR